MFDKKRWEEEIKKPDWYLFITKEYKRLKDLRNKISPEDNKNLKKDIYDFFEQHLIAGDIALGKTGKNFDEERKPIDTIVIHHTHNPPGMSAERLSAIILVRLYAFLYAKKMKGNPVYSGHFRNNKQVFYPYHWIIRTNGEIERLLLDEEIGWHAGDWDINTRSIAIVLDNNYEDSIPSDKELSSIVSIIKEHYENIQKERIFGHREINTKTTCPSNLFLSENNKGWKEKILNRF